MRFPTDLASAPTLESKKRSQKTEAMEEVGVLGWLQKRVNNSAFLSKVADKAKVGLVYSFLQIKRLFKLLYYIVCLDESSGFKRNNIC